MLKGLTRSLGLLVAALALVFTSLPSDGQAASSRTRVAQTPSYLSTPGAGTSAFYCVIKCSKSYAGALFRVTRQDGATLDVYPMGRGAHPNWPDYAQIRNWLEATGPPRGWVCTLYSQRTGGNDATNTFGSESATRCPTIELGNYLHDQVVGLSFVEYSGRSKLDNGVTDSSSNTFLQIPTGISISRFPATHLLVASVPSVTAKAQLVTLGAGAARTGLQVGNDLYGTQAGLNLQISTGLVSPGSTAILIPRNQPQVMMWSIANANGANLYLDSDVATAIGATNSTPSGTMTGGVFGGDCGGSTCTSANPATTATFTFYGYVLWASDLSAANKAAVVATFKKLFQIQGRGDTNILVRGLGSSTEAGYRSYDIGLLKMLERKLTRKIVLDSWAISGNSLTALRGTAGATIDYIAQRVPAGITNKVAHVQQGANDIASIPAPANGSTGCTAGVNCTGTDIYNTMMWVGDGTGIIEVLQARGWIVVVNTLHTRTWADNVSNRQARATEFNNAIIAGAATHGYGYVDLNSASCINTLNTNNGAPPDCHDFDNIHLNQTTGLPLASDLDAAVFNPIVGPLTALDLERARRIFAGPAWRSVRALVTTPLEIPA